MTEPIQTGRVLDNQELAVLLGIWFQLNKSRLTKTADELDDAVHQFRQTQNDVNALSLVKSLVYLLCLSKLFPLKIKKVGSYLRRQELGTRGVIGWWLLYIVVFIGFNITADIFSWWTSGWSMDYIVGELLWLPLDIIVFGLIMFFAVHFDCIRKYYRFCGGKILAERKSMSLVHFLRDKNIPSRLDFITSRLMAMSAEIEFTIEEVVINRENPKLYFLRVNVEGIVNFPIVGAWIGDIEGEKDSLRVFETASMGA